MLSGKLPKGLSIDDKGFLEGMIIDKVGDYKSQILAQNSSGQTDTLSLVIFVVHQTPAFHPLSTDIYGTLGQVIDIDLGVTGSPLPNVIVKSGQLPDGISLVQEAASWYLRGQLQGDPGQFNFELQAVSPLTQTRLNSTDENVSYAQDSFDFKVNAVKPTFKSTKDNKLSLKQFEYVNIPLHLVAHPCAVPEAENLPEGLELRGSCETGFSASGIITDRPSIYNAQISAENLAGSAKETLDIHVNPNIVPAPPASDSGSGSGSSDYSAAGSQNPNSSKQANPDNQMPENQPNNVNSQNNDMPYNTWPVILLIFFLLLAAFVFIRRKAIAVFIRKVAKK
jgi:hypothetical protein